MAAIKHDVETVYINSWVECGVYELTINSPASASLRRQKLDLVDINFVLRTGTVRVSDMIEDRGLWMVRGKTVDGELLDIWVAVRSEEYEVELLRVIKDERRER